MNRTKLKFNYVNWHGDEHEYLIIPTTLAYAGVFDSEGEEAERTWAWVMHATVYERDGVDRHSARTFVLERMENLEEIHDVDS